MSFSSSNGTPCLLLISVYCKSQVVCGRPQSVTPFILQLKRKKERKKKNLPLTQEYTLTVTPLRPETSVFPALKPWIALKGLKAFLSDSSGSPLLASEILGRRNDLYHVTQAARELRDERRKPVRSLWPVQLWNQNAAKPQDPGWPLTLSCIGNARHRWAFPKCRTDGT